MDWEQAVAEFEAAEPVEVVRAPQAIMVIYQYLGDRWHASSPSVTGFGIDGISLAGVQQAARTDLGNYLDPAVKLDERVEAGCGDYRWDDPGPDEMMPGCGHEVVDAAGTYDTGSGPAPGRGCER